MSSPPKDDLPASLESQKAIFDFVIVTLPGLLLYFLGWAYLYYYLRYFGISPSEAKLDAQTVLIYSYVPFYDIIAKHWIIATLVSLTILMLIFKKWSLPDAMNNFLQKRYRSISTLSPIPRIFSLTFVLLLALLLILSFMLIPLAKVAATDAELQQWTNGSQGLNAIIKKESSSEKNSVLSSWIVNFDQCQDRNDLSPIFSNDTTFFLLCRAERDRNSGVVFEVSKEKGLVSARIVHGGG
jgi:hypothetical protein